MDTQQSFVITLPDIHIQGEINWHIIIVAAMNILSSKLSGNRSDVDFNSYKNLLSVYIYSLAILKAKLWDSVFRQLTLKRTII